ncbi:MAG: FKBP-type peptidyl-prolyl cis-trans isomerase [Gemmatimonadales bacterium]|nr:FKBP-type peptidyl-prolyl cis-trans isomerase [Gemmatimonadales bacterium]
MSLRRFAGLLLAACVAGVPGALHAQDGSPARHGLDTVRFAPELNVDFRKSAATASGAYWRDIGVGTGELAGENSTVQVRHQLLLPDGTRIGASGDAAIDFRVGDGSVMPGLDEGVRGMRVGGRRQLVLPVEAQGRRGAEGIPGVPSGSPIVLIVDLIRAG